MNNKGFTLVELLATLVILAIVMSIGAFSIVTIVNSSKAKNYDLLITNIKEAAELYYQECKFVKNTNITCNNNNGVYEVTLGDLVLYGYLKGNSKDSQKNYTIVNPNTNTSIADCIINVKYTNNHTEVSAIASGNSNCPTYN